MADVLFRPQRGSLARAMEEVATVHSRRDIERLTGATVSDVRPYTYDARINWDTYIVLTDDNPAYPGQAIGFTNGPLPVDPHAD